MSKPHGHHVLFTKKVWMATETGRKLRSTPELIIPLDNVVHGHLHRRVEQIPLPDRYMLGRIATEFYPVRHDHLETIRNLQQATWEAANHPHTSGLAVRMGALFIDSLQAQIPFILEQENGTA